MQCMQYYLQAITDYWQYLKYCKRTQLGNCINVYFGGDLFF